MARKKSRNPGTSWAKLALFAVGGYAIYRALKNRGVIGDSSDSGYQLPTPTAVAVPTRMTVFVQPQPSSLLQKYQTKFSPKAAPYSTPRVQGPVDTSPLRVLPKPSVSRTGVLPIYEPGQFDITGKPSTKEVTPVKERRKWNSEDFDTIVSNLRNDKDMTPDVRPYWDRIWSINGKIQEKLHLLQTAAPSDQQKIEREILEDKIKSKEIELSIHRMSDRDFLEYVRDPEEKAELRELYNTLVKGKSHPQQPNPRQIEKELKALKEEYARVPEVQAERKQKDVSELENQLRRNAIFYRDVLRRTADDYVRKKIEVESAERSVLMSEGADKWNAENELLRAQRRLGDVRRLLSEYPKEYFKESNKYIKEKADKIGTSGVEAMRNLRAELAVSHQFPGVVVQNEEETIAAERRQLEALYRMRTATEMPW